MYPGSGTDALQYLKLNDGDEDIGIQRTIGTLILAKVSDAESVYFNDEGKVLYSDGIEPKGFLRSKNPTLYNYSSSLSTFIKPKNEDIYKTFFGFGDGLNIDLSDTANGNNTTNIGKRNQLVGFKDFSYYTMYKNRVPDGAGSTTPYTYEPAQIRLHEPILRGWRYGLYSGVPTADKLVFRRNRYGQFRDILEGRTYTATLILSEDVGTRQTLEYPIGINFVTGTVIYQLSRDYITSSNPDYNPYDSGIYDIYYRSGQPFFDRGNED